MQTYVIEVAFGGRWIYYATIRVRCAQEAASWLMNVPCTHKFRIREVATITIR